MHEKKHFKTYDNIDVIISQLVIKESASIRQENRYPQLEFVEMSR